MRTAFFISCLFLTCTLLCSCPYSSTYQLDDEPGIYVEDAIMGKWATYIKKAGGKEAVVKLTLSKKTDTEYNISFTGDLNELKPFNVIVDDSINGSAFMSTVDANQFLNIHIKAQVYIAEIKLKDDKLSLLPLVEHFTYQLVKGNIALRNCVSDHYKTRVRPMFDDNFCLKDMVRVN